MRVSKAGNRVKERVGEVKLPLEIYRIIGLGNWLQRAPSPLLLPLRQLDFHITHHATLLIPPHSIYILFVICRDEKRKEMSCTRFLSSYLFYFFALFFSREEFSNLTSHVCCGFFLTLFLAISQYCVSERRSVFHYLATWS